VAFGPPLIALTRGVSDAIGQCELTHLDRHLIDVSVAREQHHAYERTLERLGCRIVRVEDAPDLPDAVFVEDTAVVVDELAIITRPGALSRRHETAGVVNVMERFRTLAAIEAPGTVDGGDVLVAGRHVFVGRSTRTNDAGIRQLRDILESAGYDVRDIDVGGCLHLKSAVTSLSDECLLVNPSWVSREALAGFDLLEIDAAEPFAANVVRAGGRLIYPAAFPRTRARMERLGFDVHPVDVSELAKAEGAVTCCSIIFRDSAGLTQ
jgi:dimethylargininase